MTATADLGFAHSLGAHGDNLAVVAPDGRRITYRELDVLVGNTAERLGPVRRLVLLVATNDLDSLVTYLAALRGGHPVLLASAAQVDSLVAAYDPDVVIDSQQDGRSWDERRAGTAHRLHPDLALLLSTSGTTGSPKLVRLSADAVKANAAAIAEYLDIRATDRAITSLPMHYCYGLSVVNSNLLCGAGLVLTDRSVVDPAFWSAVREHGVTSLHGVPHTFDLLDGVGFADLDLPSLRYVTQAGGRMDPAQVTRYAALGPWRFFVMYGQTEATARMAYLPPELASSRPSAIGVPIPGGAFRIDDGELVYLGPNVMLGYAERPADLALGRTTWELRTGDLARLAPDGLYEVIGRRSRFLKLFGLRVDLDQVERVLAEEGLPAACTGSDDQLVVAVRGAARRAGEVVHARFGLRGACVRVHEVDEFPRLPNGKVDYRSIAALGSPAAEASSIRQVFASVLGLKDVPSGATFVELGGDSLCYVRMSIALERQLGRLPRDWPTTTVADLESLRPAPRRVPMVETNIVLRALAIVLVVGSHIKFFEVLGGAHLLLVLAGWNFARFLLPASPTRILRSTALIAAPAVLWLTYRAAVTEDVTWVNILLVNNFVGTGATGYWFIETLVHALLVLAVVFTVPWLRRRSENFSFALAFLAATLLPRLGFDDASSFAEQHLTTLGAMWFFALGWVARQAATTAQKCAVALLGNVLILSLFDDHAREGVVLTGLVLLLALSRVPVPKPLVGAVSLVASASLYIYLTHYAVFPVLLEHLHPSLVVVLSVVVGIAAWRLAGVLPFASISTRAPAGTRAPGRTFRPAFPVRYRTFRRSHPAP